MTGRARFLLLVGVVGALLTGSALAAPVPAERLAAVAIHGGSATTYSGSSAALPARRSFRGAERAVLSPDAELVAYTRRAGDTIEIRVARVDGGQERVVARVRPYDVAIAFSPDGARLAYSHSSASAIATVGVRGTDRRRIRLPAAWKGSRFVSLAYAPDGRRLAVSRTSGDGRAGTLRNELALLELATGRATTLFRPTNPYDMQARPASFTPDGSHVLVDGTHSIRVVPTTPGEDRVLAPPPQSGSDHSPIVSQDGRYVAFARSPYRGVSDVYVVRFDGTELRRVTTTPIPPRGTPKVGSFPLAWSPDARKLLAFRHDRFAIVDVATRASTDLRQVGVRYGIASARWSGTVPEPPKAGTIVFAREDELGGSDLYTVGADGTGLRRLTSNGLSFDPAWSPDGSRIAFTGGHALRRQLYVGNADGSVPLALTAFAPGFVWQPSWYRGGATGLRILFTLYTPGGSDLYAVGSDGRTVAPIAARPEPELNGSFSPDGVLAYDDESGIWVRENGVSRLLHAGTEPQWSPDGRRLAFLLHNGLHGGLVGVIAADGSGYRSLGWGWSPSWSPDGTAIVYATDEGLVAVRADGVGRARRLTRTTGVIRDSSPSWSATAIR